MASKQANRQAITLKGSTTLVTEFFKYAVNTCVCLPPLLRATSHLIHSILFQREVYPSDDFHMVKKYGQTVLVTQDLALENYLERYDLSFVIAYHLTVISAEFLNKFRVSVHLLDIAWTQRLIPTRVASHWICHAASPCHHF